MTTLSDKMLHYQPNSQMIDSVKESKLALLVGITGAGKDTIKNRLLESDTFFNFISYTTRTPRENKGVMEQNGREYYFISLEMAEKMLEDGDFIEAKEYAGNVYGTSFIELQKALPEGKIAVNDIEVQGIGEYKKYLPGAIAIFIVPPSFDEWQRRLKLRYDEDEFTHEWPKRREAAIRELTHALKVPYYHFVINDDLDQAEQAVRKIIAGQDDFTRKDDEARLAARDILAAIQSQI